MLKKKMAVFSSLFHLLILSGVSSYQPTKVFGDEPNWKPPSSTFHSISRNHPTSQTPSNGCTHRDTHFPDAIHQKLLGWTAPTSHVNQSPSTTEKREVQNGEWKKRGVRMRGMASYEGWGQVAQQVLTPSFLSCLTVFGGIASVKNFRQRNKDVESFALRVSWLIGWLSKAPTTLISPRFTGSWFKFPKSFPFNSIPQTLQTLWAPFGFLCSAYLIFLGNPEET